MAEMTPKYRGAFALAMQYGLTLTGDPKILYSDLEERGWLWIESQQLWALRIKPTTCPKCGSEHCLCWDQNTADYLDHQGEIVTLPRSYMLCTECKHGFIHEDPAAQGLVILDWMED